MAYRQTHILDGISHGGDYRIEAPRVMLLRRKDAESGVVASYVHDVVDMYRFAVDVRRTVGCALDDDAVGAESVDDGIFGDKSRHQVGTSHHGAQS